MAKEYGAFTYAGKDLEKFMLAPQFADVTADEFGIKVEFTKDSAVSWATMSVGDTYIYPFRSGFQGGASAKITDKKVALVEFKKEAAFDARKYKQRIQRLTLPNGAFGNDLGLGELTQKEIYFQMQGVRMGLWKSLWLGNTAKVHTTAGYYNQEDNTQPYAINDPDIRYNITDGIWTEIAARKAANLDNIPYLDISAVDGSSNPIFLDSNGNLKEDAMEEIFRQVLNNASEELYELFEAGRAAFFVTTPCLQNYNQTIISPQANLESARTIFLDGFKGKLKKRTYQGAVIHDMRISAALRNDFANNKPFRVLLTPPENIQMYLGLGSSSEAMFWFNKDENQNRVRIQCEYEHTFLDPKFISCAY